MLISSGGEPVHQPALPPGDEHHGGERAAPRPHDPRQGGRHGHRTPPQRLTLQHDHPLVTTINFTLYYKLTNDPSYINSHGSQTRNAGTAYSSGARSGPTGR